MTIGFCTDSNSQLPPELASRYDAEIVPLTVIVDGESFLEGEELDADAFYARYADGATPVVSTAAPSPGQFVTAYERLAARGATEILSIHLGSAISATFNAARLAADLSPVPVRAVDTGVASFAIACCLWEAAEAVAKGAGIEEAAALAESVGASCGNLFVVGALGIVRAGGRMLQDVLPDAPDAIPVLSMGSDGKIVPIGQARSPMEAAVAMASHIRSAGTGLRVGISVADEAATPIREALEELLKGAPEVIDLVRYRVGPSVGAHTGPGTAGAVYYPSR